MLAFVFQLEAVHAGLVAFLAQQIAPLVQQVGAQTALELRVWLDAEHLLPERERGHRAKIAAGHQRGAGR